MLFKLLSEKTAYYLATQVEDYWRYRGLKAYYDLPISWHDSQDSGEIASRIESGGSAVFTVIYELVGQVFFVDTVTLLFVLPLAYSANPSFFWVLFLPIPIVTTTTYFISKKIAEGQNRLNELYKQAQKALFDAQNEGASIGQVVLLLSYQQLVFSPFTRLNSLFTRVRRQANRVKVLLRIIDESDKANEEVRPLELGVLDSEIKFRNVSFAYTGKGEAVKNVNFNIRKGSTVALVGRSGAGKTTIAALIAGFYSPTKGKILWDGDDLSKTNRASISKQVSYVAQDSALFNRSIKANVAYADENATHKEVESAATHAHAHEFVMSMRHKYRSVIGEKGV
ncbi:MAG: ABC transporter ATP-binding protein, partial [Armatimonadetes bacterium]|nr:ABC transporter ATP-binding protein [Armatimonadota bacterium]